MNNDTKNSHLVCMASLLLYDRISPDIEVFEHL